MAIKPLYIFGGVFFFGGAILLAFLLITNNPTDDMTSLSPDGLGQSSVEEIDEQQVIATYFAPLLPMIIGGVPVLASVANTDETRRQGLSDTPYLPPGVVKLFAFDDADRHGIWMKDMNYSIDIIWVNEDLEIVYIAPFTAPETYPAVFTPTSDALYVIEAPAGFTDQFGISLGTIITLPVL